MTFSEKWTKSLSGSTTTKIDRELLNVRIKDVGNSFQRLWTGIIQTILPSTVILENNNHHNTNRFNFLYACNVLLLESFWIFHIVNLVSKFKFGKIIIIKAKHGGTYNLLIKEMLLQLFLIAISLSTSIYFKVTVTMELKLHFIMNLTMEANGFYIYLKII